MKHNEGALIFHQSNFLLKYNYTEIAYAFIAEIPAWDSTWAVIAHLPAQIETRNLNARI